MAQGDESEVWGHIRADRFAEAAAALRELIARSGPEDHRNLWRLFGPRASTLNSHERHGEATEALRCALAHAYHLSTSATNASRYMLGNQHLHFGKPEDALEIVEPLPSGVGHAECLLHAVAAEALWALDRHGEAFHAAGNVFSATDEDHALLFPGDSDIAFAEDFESRPEAALISEALARLWANRIPKAHVIGIHGTLFYELFEKRQFYPTRRDEEARNPGGSKLRR
jgi:hypothetical protein